VGGLYSVDICEVANMMKIHVADVQRDLMKLKNKREISVRWGDKAFCVQVTLQAQPLLEK